MKRTQAFFDPAVIQDDNFDFDNDTDDDDDDDILSGLKGLGCIPAMGCAWMALMLTILGSMFTMLYNIGI